MTATATLAPWRELVLTDTIQAMAPAALIISILALAAAGTSVFYARQQAHAARQQAEDTHESLSRSERWRAQERNEAKPRFTVNANPVGLVDLDRGSSYNRPGSVEVVIENTSTREAIINHLGIEDILNSSSEIFTTLPGGIKFPQALAPGHQLYWSIPGDKFFVHLDSGHGDDLSKESDFAVFASRALWFNSSETARWDSQPFNVQRPTDWPQA